MVKYISKNLASLNRRTCALHATDSVDHRMLHPWGQSDAVSDIGKQKTLEPCAWWKQQGTLPLQSLSCSPCHKTATLLPVSMPWTAVHHTHKQCRDHVLGMEKSLHQKVQTQKHTNTRACACRHTYACAHNVLNRQETGPSVLDRHLLSYPTWWVTSRG